MPRSRKVDELPIPVRLIYASTNSTNTITLVEFPGFEPEEVTYWQNLGFYQAIALPYEHRKIAGVNVLVVKPSLRSNSTAQEYGFSPAISVTIPKASEVWRLVRDSIGKEKLLLSTKNQ
jgi:hypothetical protein